MATAAQWVAGARPRTLPAAVAPVLVGSGAAAFAHGFRLPEALLALVVAVALQVGVNYHNDYSDGVKGTDERRVGPVRLVGQRLAPPNAVAGAAILAFALGAVAGLALVARSGLWWLLPVGVAAVAAGWLYTGGPRPYGYAGLGEVFVFLFFGVVAVVGTTATQLGHVTTVSLVASVPVGLWAVAILVANNLRDIPTDAASGKRTLAVRLGDRRTRVLFAVVVVGAFGVAAAMAVWSVWALLAQVAWVFAVRPLRAVLAGAVGAELVPALAGTGLVLLVGGAGLGAGLALS